MIDLQKVDFSKGDGLVPAILQDAQTHQVLMVGYMNAAALEKTLAEKVAYFYSRTKDRLWMKGESSGHLQEVVAIHLDCDQDALLVTVRPKGPTCHLNRPSCFDQEFFNLGVLERTVQQKIGATDPDSYTHYLLEAGLDKQLKKLGEEATEVVIAAKNQDSFELVAEVSDLLYHLLVVLASQGLRLEEVLGELASRHGQQTTYSVRPDIERW